MDRIMARIVVNDDGCWVYPVSHKSDGYGRVRQCAADGGAKVLVHRATYEALVGPIPDGLELDHVWARGCRSNSCCNPAHLEPVTHAGNMGRGWHARKTHCKSDHPLSGDNLLTTKNPKHRGCRACACLSTRRYKQKKRDAVTP